MNDGTTTIEEQLRNGNAVTIWPRGHSMEPLLYEGKSSVLVEPFKGRLQTGDLLLYMKPNGVYVLHRIVKIAEGGYYTRGDNCILDEWVSQNRIIGVVTEFSRGTRHIQVTNCAYRFYVYFWLVFSPIRIFFMRIYRSIRKHLHFKNSKS